ncbi:hypothetical protein GCM10027035_50770 [Emticicia sediminis]
MEKRKLKYFVSYAHKNEVHVADFLGKFEDHFNISKKYDIEKWIDGDIIIGEDWHKQIQAAIESCDFGLLLLSSTYFNRKYIKNDELPHFINSAKILKPIIPVGLDFFDVNGDLLGLEKLQIFRYQKNLGEDYKFYSELKDIQRTKFINELVQKMAIKFDKTQF